MEFDGFSGPALSVSVWQLEPLFSAEDFLLLPTTYIYMLTASLVLYSDLCLVGFLNTTRGLELLLIGGRRALYGYSELPHQALYAIFSIFLFFFLDLGLFGVQYTLEQSKEAAWHQI